MEDILREQAAVLFEMAAARKRLARMLMDECHQLRALGTELLAVADVLTGGAGLSQTFHPQVTNLNDEAFLDGVPNYGNLPPVNSVADVLAPMATNTNGVKPREIFHLSTRINQSALINQAMRRVAMGSTVGIAYPNGDLLVVTPENIDKISIPHAVD